MFALLESFSCGLGRGVLLICELSSKQLFLPEDGPRERDAHPFFEFRRQQTAAVFGSLEG